MKKEPGKILVVKVSTTGFIPARDHILEVACILCQPSRAGGYEIINTMSSVVRQSAEVLATAPDFHAQLVALCASPDAPSLKATEGFLLAGGWADNCQAVCSRALTQFHLPFLAVHMPLLHAKLIKKWHLELKALELTALARGKAPYKAEGARSYRAPDDAIAAFEELEWLST